MSGAKIQTYAKACLRQLTRNQQKSYCSFAYAALGLLQDGDVGIGVLLKGFSEAAMWSASFGRNQRSPSIFSR